MIDKIIDNAMLQCDTGDDGIVNFPNMGDSLNLENCASQVKSNPECSPSFFYSIDGSCQCEKIDHNCKRISSPRMAEYRLMKGSIYYINKT